MRIIRFRGLGHDGIWYYGSLAYFQDGERPHIIPDPGDEYQSYGLVRVISESIGQFTGLSDKNGKLIYEGDIITTNGRYPRVVLWDKISWALMPTVYYHDESFWVMNLQHPGLDWWEHFASEFEIIGNIMTTRSF